MTTEQQDELEGGASRQEPSEPDAGFHDDDPDIARHATTMARYVARAVKAEIAPAVGMLREMKLVAKAGERLRRKNARHERKKSAFSGNGSGPMR
jgi:hypothetical protein